MNWANKVIASIFKLENKNQQGKLFSFLFSPVCVTFTFAVRAVTKWLVCQTLDRAVLVRVLVMVGDIALCFRHSARLFGGIKLTPNLGGGGGVLVILYSLNAT